MHVSVIGIAITGLHSNPNKRKSFPSFACVVGVGAVKCEATARVLVASRDLEAAKSRFSHSAQLSTFRICSSFELERIPMATSLHQQLKALYAASPDEQEVAVDGYRIDALADGKLIEVQQSALGAIRTKVRKLVDAGHEVVVVKPLIARKLLIKRDRKRGKIVSRRKSPKRESFHDVFLELVHFMGAFPKPGLTLELVRVEVEEHRLPALKNRRNRKGYRVEDRRLASIVDRLSLRTADDLIAMLPDCLPTPFSTDDISAGCEIARWLAQKMAYCLRKAGGIQQVGKSGNSLLYEIGESENWRPKAA